MYKSSLIKNFLYNLIFQLSIIILPLITIPYISRIFGVEGMGIISYTLSISQYFMIIGSLGISIYGSRAIAYVREDKENMSKTFWSIYSINLISTIISLVIYILMFSKNEKYGYIFLIQSINILAVTVDISWLFMGLENFKKTALRNTIIKIVCVICIFIFVKNSDHIYLYVFINAIMAFLGNLVLWFDLSNVVKLSKVKFSDMKKHFIPIIVLFIPQIAMQIYGILDKTMLGSLANVSEVALYDQAQKIIKLGVGLITTLGVVMLPRMSTIFSTGDRDIMRITLSKNLRIVCFIAIPMSFGIAGISPEFVKWFFGNEFSKVSYLIILLAPALIFMAIGNVFGMQYLLPSNRNKEFTISVIIGACVNVVFNLILIPKFQAIGACVSTILAEISVAFIQYYTIRNEIILKYTFKNIIKYILSATSMFMILRVIGDIMDNSIITNVAQVIIGIIIYILLLIILKEDLSQEIIYIIKLYFNKILKKINKEIA